MKSSAQTIKSLGREILAYLGRHPEAQDTLEGIMDWWLFEQHITLARAEVANALERLVTAQKLLAWLGPDSRTHYRLFPQKAQENAR